MILLWLKFLACVAIIAVAGSRVAKYGDVIAEKTGLGGVWVGVVLMAVATSLPELFTGISAVAFVGEPDLTIGNLFGANTFNLVNLAFLDIAYRRAPLLTRASSGNVLTAGLSVVLVAFAAGSILASGVFNLSLGWVGIYTPIIILLYLAMVWMIHSYEQRQRNNNTATTETLRYADVSLKRAYTGYAVAAVCIIGAGTWLAFIGDEIVGATGLSTSSVGSLFIAFSTTLPEFTVSLFRIAAGCH